MSQVQHENRTAQEKLSIPKQTKALTPEQYEIYGREDEQGNPQFYICQAHQEDKEMLLIDFINSILASSQLAENYTLLYEKNQRMRLVQKRFFAGDKLKSTVAEAKRLEKENDNFLAVRGKNTYDSLLKLRKR